MLSYISFKARPNNIAPAPGVPPSPIIAVVFSLICLAKSFRSSLAPAAATLIPITSLPNPAPLSESSRHTSMLLYNVSLIAINAVPTPPSVLPAKSKRPLLNFLMLSPPTPNAPEKAVTPLVA